MPVQLPMSEGHASALTSAAKSAAASAADSVKKPAPRLMLHSPANLDLFHITGFEGIERISGSFALQVNLLAEQDLAHFFSPELLVRQPLAVGVLVDSSAAGERRYFHGVVSRCAQVGSDGKFTAYEAEIMPWTWLLSQTADCRVFQNESVLDIVEKIFNEAKAAFPHLVRFHIDVQRDKEKFYPPLDYCVQYRETDFSFVSRLLEQEGVHYYFEHEKDGHTLVLADTPNHSEVPHSRPVHFRPDARNGRPEPMITRWTLEKRFVPGKYTLNDFHFQKPLDSLEVSSPSLFNLPGHEQLEVYDFPAETAQRFNMADERLDKVKEAGEIQAKTRMEELESQHAEAGGKSNCADFRCGAAFEFQDHFDPRHNRKFLLTFVSHWARQSSGAGSRGEGGVDYVNEFRCVPDDIEYRPPRRTPKPVIHGLQSAFVASSDGAEIQTDKYGRVLVWFRWDRMGKPFEQNSCWLRVSQPWAGKGWGTCFWPRAGSEVLVSFLEGDPDQPIIIGSVYNAANMPPHELPANQTQSGVKTRSTPDGTAENYNEIRFEDKKGQEEVFVQAERNLRTVVKASEFRTIGSLRETTIEDHDVLIVKNKSRETYVEKGDDFVSVPEGAHDVRGKVIRLTADDKIVFTVGGSTIEMTSDTIKIDGPMVLINS